MLHSFAWLSPIHFTDLTLRIDHIRESAHQVTGICAGHLLAYMNDVAISFCVNTFSFLFDVHLGVQLLDHRLILYPKFFSESSLKRD